MSKNLYICADDYAQNESISTGILNLLKKNKINATSCLVNSPDWDKWGEALLPLTHRVFIGLHLNFTHGCALSSSWQNHYGARFQLLSWLIKMAYTKRLNKDCVKAEIELQIERFIKTMGFFPDFIDGHQHIHQLPMIRDLLLAQREFPNLSKHLDNRIFFFRTTSQHWFDCFSMKAFPKRSIIACLGGWAFKKRLIEKNIKSNTTFSGIYNFANASQYPQYFQTFLQESKNGGLIMCHPGLASHDEMDAIRQSRVYEMDYFLSEAYLTDLQKAHVQLLVK